VTSAIKYLGYLFNARSAHGIHSPFVYRFIHELLKSKKDNYYQFEELEKIRQRLLQDNMEITIVDFGAGSKIFKDNKRKISDIARHGISQRKFSELYFKLINFCNAEYVVELGTSLGLNTLYLSRANSKAKIYSIEGCKEIASFARDFLKKEGATNVEIINETFENAFPKLLQELPRVDFLYIDGNHRYKNTLEYFREGLSKKHNDSVFVFDDINWNDEMRKAWKEIKSHADVTLSIDLFFTGIIFFRKEQKEKEHFVLKF
jgi:predicted O-methyltransferase YrrM